MNKKPFRLKDKITGLYYCPSRKIQVKKDGEKYGRYIKSNLSKKGKIYFQDPRKHCKVIYDHTHVTWGGFNEDYPEPSLRHMKIDDWEIEYL